MPNDPNAGPGHEPPRAFPLFGGPESSTIPHRTAAPTAPPTETLAPMTPPSRSLPLALLLGLVGSMLVLSPGRAASAEDESSAVPEPSSELARYVALAPFVDDDGVEFHLPADWPAGHPLPIVKNNCVRCHVDKGGALTEAVFHYGQSSHDVEELSCHDCHGGNTDDDETAHEGDFISGKLSALMQRCADCHARESRLFDRSAHFREQIRYDHPICSTCHENHSAGKGGRSMEAACTTCHGTKSRATTGEGESAIDWESRTEGAHGDAISIELKTEGPGRELAMTWARNDAGGADIVVSLATDADGKSISIAEEVLDAIKKDKELYYILKAQESGDSLGEGVVEPVARFHLTGGAGFEAKYPEYAGIVAANDALWGALERFRSPARVDLPDDVDAELALARNQAMRVLHAVPEKPDAEELKVYVERSARLVERLESLAATAGK